ncbi:MAG: hypothetical protein AAF414_21505 [Pseudomonadota bacterium]
MTDRSAEEWNYRAMLGQGTARNVGIELSSEKLVLPFLYSALGGSVVYTGLLVPVVILARLVAQLLGSRLVGVSRITKWYLALATAIVAVPLVAVNLVAPDLPTRWLPALFIAAAAVIGVGIGFGTLTYQDMMGRVLTLDHRNRLLFITGAISGAVSALAAVASQFVEGFDRELEPSSDHLHLIWAGAAMMLVASVSAASIREPAKPLPKLEPAAKSKGYGTALKDSLGVVLKLSWLRRFMVARILFLSVELTMPFLAVHAAGLYAETSISLSLFVVASGIGLLVGGLLWPRVAQSSVKRVLTVSCLMSSAAGITIALSHLIPEMQSTATEAAMIILIAIATQGIITGSALYVVNAATDEERPYCLAVANFPTGIIGIGMALALGHIAEGAGIDWVLGALAVLSVLSALYATTLPDAQRAA